MGKTSILVNDTPGFATSRLIGILQNEAIHAFAEGIASVEDIDKGMKLGMNHPMGPLELAAGLDYVIVCPPLKPFDYVGLLSLNGEDNNGHGG
jgi:3-hydroxyacyl-CoA dehydrogenase